MKYKLYFSLILYGLYSCNSTAGPKTSTVTPIKYVVLVEMNKSMLNSDPESMDTAAINSALDKFEEDVQSSMIVRSMDKFAIRVTPQHCNPVISDQIEDELILDLSQYSAAEKISKLKQFKEELPEKIKQLYRNAQKNTVSTNQHSLKKAQSNEVTQRESHKILDSKVMILTDIITMTK